MFSIASLPTVGLEKNIREWDGVYLRSDSGKYILCDQLKLSYRDSVLYLHGRSSEMETWRLVENWENSFVLLFSELSGDGPRYRVSASVNDMIFFNRVR